MRIPSYDDLTPSIPDIRPHETLSQVTRILPSSLAVTGGPGRPRPGGPASARSGSAGAAPGGAPPDRSAPAGSAPEGSAPITSAGPVAGLFACLRSTRPPGVLLAIAREFSPRVERHGGGSVGLDVSGLGRLLGDPQAIGDALARAAGDHAAGIRVAVAPTQTAARLLAIAHPRLVVVAHDPAAALASLPLGALRALALEEAGAGGGARGDRARASAAERRLDTFHRWGLRTLGDVAALPADALAARMGQDGLRLQQRARGRDAAPLVPDPETPRFLQSMALEWPIDTLEPLSFVLARLLDPLAAALERADRGAAALRLDLRLVDRTTVGRVLQLPAAMRDPRVLRTLLQLDLESHPPRAAIDVVTLEIDPAPGRIVQYSLLERAMPSVETLATLTARLSALVGDARCGSPALLDTHRPDGFEMRRFDPESTGARRTGATGALRAGRSGRSLRPAGGAAPPGPPVVPPATDDAAQAPGAGAGADLTRVPALRRFRPPVAVRVAVERGRPSRVAIDRRGMPGGAVQQHAGPWRTSGAWWDPEGACWDRDEWDVALDDGSLCRLFHDRRHDRWFLDGVFD